MSLLEDVRAAINRNSAESGSGTPDIILANFLTRVLDAFDMATRERDLYAGRTPGGDEDEIEEDEIEED